jgi:hypothetical protein
MKTTGSIEIVGHKGRAKTYGVKNMSPSDALLRKLHATSMNSFGEMAFIVMTELGWKRQMFLCKTGYSCETYYRIHKGEKRDWDMNLVLTFCWSTGVSRRFRNACL